MDVLISEPRITAGVDGSAESLRGVRWAAREAGRSELAGAVLGSVSNAVVHHAPCPVAVIRPHTPRQVRR